MSDLVFALIQFNYAKRSLDEMAATETVVIDGFVFRSFLSLEEMMADSRPQSPPPPPRLPRVKKKEKRAKAAVAGTTTPTETATVIPGIAPRLPKVVDRELFLTWAGDAPKLTSVENEDGGRDQMPQQPHQLKQERDSTQLLFFTVIYGAESVKILDILVPSRLKICIDVLQRGNQ